MGRSGSDRKTLRALTHIDQARIGAEPRIPLGSHGFNRYDPAMGALSRIYLVRHGEVEIDWRSRIYGGLDVPLADTGMDQARQAAERLASVELDGVWSSHLERARFGGRQILDRQSRLGNTEPEPWSEFAEIDRGDWAGLTFDELEQREPGAFAAWKADPCERRPPGGESLHDLAERVLPAVDRLARELDGGTAALVAHGWVIRTILCAASGLPLHNCTRYRVVPASIAAVDWSTNADTSQPPREPRRRAPGPYLSGLDLQGAGPAGRGWYRRPEHR